MTKDSLKVSVVVPVYKCHKTLEELVERIRKNLANYSPFEIILINDGCPNSSWDFIQSLSRKFDNVKGIKLSRNFGQHFAIHAGLEHATGEFVVVMDCDLQDEPEEIPRLLKAAEEGYDIILAQRSIRKDTIYKKLTSKIFYGILSYLTSTKQDASVANFGVYRTKVINAVLSMGDYIRYFPTMINWVGFSSKSIEVKHNERKEGKTSYSLTALLNLGINVIIAFSDRPLKLIIRFGIIICVFTSVVGVYLFVQYLRGSIIVTGWTSLILSIWFFSGLIISLIGAVSLYIGKIFEQVKARPRYIISEKTNF